MFFASQGEVGFAVAKIGPRSVFPQDGLDINRQKTFPRFANAQPAKKSKFFGFFELLGFLKKPSIGTLPDMVVLP